MTMRTVRFKVRRGYLEPLEPVPLVEGDEIDVPLRIDEGSSTCAGLLELMRQSPGIDPSIVDEWEQAIRAAKVPARPGGVFDEEQE